MLDTTRDVVRKSLLAMLGAITLADDELEQLLDRLAARGEQVARDRFSHIEALRNRLTGSEGAAREGLREGALLRQTLREEIERQGRLLAAALDLPTRDSINLLREQIEQISTMLNQIVAQHTPVTTPTDNGQAPAPAPATPVPQQAVETPAPAAVQPEAVETPAPAAVPQPELGELSAPAAATQPELGEPSAPAAVQPEAVETPAPAAVPQPELGEPSTPTMTAPVPGYDALNAKQAAAIVTELEEADLLALHQYEQAHRNRVTVLRAIEAALARHRGES
jgi:outer membrane biosynthesis protein TonB